jgi:hypothetical protein
MSAPDLTPIQRAVRIIVAQHLPNVPADRATSYADKIHLAAPLMSLGLTDGAFVAATISIEATYGFDLPDSEWEQVKTVGDMAKLVERYAAAEVAA